MRKNFIKKITAAALSLSMVIGSTGVAFAATHAANGANIAASTSWTSFSVRDDLHGLPVTDWEKSLLDEIAKAQAEGKEDAESYQSFTEGYFTAKPVSSGFVYYVKNSGWDGEYNPYTGDLIGDNPWGMTIQTGNMPVEKLRKYTISFNIKSTLEGSVTVKDESGNPKKDETGKEITEKTYIKHIGFKAYDPVSQGGPAVDFDVISGANTSGIIELDSRETAGKNVTATITIPATYGSESLGVMFALGARLVSYPDELAMKGNVTVSNFKITAGDQYSVTFTGNGKNVTSYVNGGSSIAAPLASQLGKKGYNIDYYTFNGKKYTTSVGPVNSNMTLTAHYAKTKKPAKPKISKANNKSKKKIKLTIKKTKNAVGYQIKYSLKKNMKKAKTKTTTKKTYTIKKGLKSGKFVYIQVRGYNKDDLGNKVFGKWSKKKKTVVR